MPRISSVFSILSQEVRREANDANTLNTKRESARCTEVCGRDDAGAKRWRDSALHSPYIRERFLRAKSKGGGWCTRLRRKKKSGITRIARAKLEIEWRTPERVAVPLGGANGAILSGRVENGKTHTRTHAQEERERERPEDWRDAK